MQQEPIPSFQLPALQADLPDFRFELVPLTGPHNPLAGVPHRHDYYNLCILMQGEMPHNVDFTTYTVKAPAVLLLDYDQVHVHDTPPGCTVAYLSFTPGFLAPYPAQHQWQQLFRRPWLPLLPAQLQQLQHYLELIAPAFHETSPFRDALLKDLLHALLLFLAQIAAEQQPPDNGSAAERLYREFRQLVQEHYLTDTQVAQYAARLFVTPGHLNMTVKKQSGYSAKQLIDKRRLLEAKRLLYWQHIPVKEISWQLHFEDEAYFTRFFKKQTGLTPQAFRKQIHEKYRQ